MDQDDPERRIAELERQLAEQKHIVGPERLTHPAANAATTVTRLTSVSTALRQPCEIRRHEVVLRQPIFTMLRSPGSACGGLS